MNSKVSEKAKQSQRLTDEAVMMELRLAELRETMAREKARREALADRTGRAGSVWASATEGPLRASSTRSFLREVARQDRPRRTGPTPSTTAPLAMTHAALPHVGHDTGPPRGMSIGTNDDDDNWDEAPRQGALPRPTAIPSSSRHQAMRTSNAQHDDDGLLQGDFNENESRQSFLAALMEWRGQGTTEPSTASRPTAAAPFSTHHISTSGTTTTTETDAMPRTTDTTATLTSTFDRVLISQMARAASDAAMHQLKPPPLSHVDPIRQEEAMERAVSAALELQDAPLPTEDDDEVEIDYVEV